MKKLITLVAVAATTVVWAAPAHADKAPGVVVSPDEPGGDKNSKHTIPFAELPCFPCPAGDEVDDVGGQVLYIGSDGEVEWWNLVGEDIDYSETTCADGAASGTLTIQQKTDEDGNPLTKGGDDNKGDPVTYDVEYTRVGANAAFVATSDKGDQLTAVLTFHPKGDPVEFAQRCAAGSGGALNVEFEVVGIYVQ